MVRLELTEPLWWHAMQPSLTTMKTVTACEQALHLRASSTRNETLEQCAGKKVRALRFFCPSRLHRSLARSLATQNGEVATSRLHFLVVLHVRYSVSQIALGIPRKNSSYLHTKQRLLWLHVFFYTDFNQPLTINNIAAVTRAWHKKSCICVIQRCPSVHSDSVLFTYSIYSINRPGRLLNFWTLRVGAHSRLGAY